MTANHPAGCCKANPICCRPGSKGGRIASTRNAIPPFRLLSIGVEIACCIHLRLIALVAFQSYSATSSQLEVKGGVMDIAEVSRRSGLAASTLRFYEDKGLIRSNGRIGLRRVFDPAVLERLVLISLGRTAGFSLDEIALMLTPDGRTQINRQMLIDRAKELNKTIRKLRAMRDGLRHAAACSAPSHMECPTFQRILRATEGRMIRTNKSKPPNPPRRRP